MAISGVGQNYYQNNVETKRNTKNVNGTEKICAGKDRKYAGIIGSGRNGTI